MSVSGLTWASWTTRTTTENMSAESRGGRASGRGGGRGGAASGGDGGGGDIDETLACLGKGFCD